MKPQGSASRKKARSSALKRSPAASVMRALAMAAAYLRRGKGSRRALLASIHLQAARLDRALPTRDLLDHIFGEELGPAPFGRHADHTDVVEAHLDRRRVHPGVSDFF